ncbi:MAG: type II toxin-antitoxin system PemK/MazF family toxin [Nitrospirae bacterium]|nr:type II toxin-antitoxin system PemK/MazF family toxin [Nitrospirota bacterium]
MTLKRGDIVLVPFPFTDLSSQKVRCALVLTLYLKYTDVVIAFISSYIHQKVLSTDYILDLGHTDFPATGLKKTSVLRMNKLLTVQRSLIIRRLGKISPAIQNELDRRLRVAIGL